MEAAREAAFDCDVDGVEDACDDADDVYRNRFFPMRRKNDDLV